MADIKALIRSVPDFPKPGIVFRDITTILKDKDGLAACVDQIADRFAGRDIDIVVGIESRGFIFGPAIAIKLDAAFVPIRKPGKLPADTLKQSYELEYGTDEIEIHKDAIEPGQKVLMVDDLLATGGTMAASCQLVEKLGGNIQGVAFVIELTFLNGRDKLDGYDIASLVSYDSE